MNRTNREKLVDGIIGGLFVYGSAIGISYLTHWAVGILLIVFIVGHNMEMHKK